MWKTEVGQTNGQTDRQTDGLTDAEEKQNNYIKVDNWELILINSPMQSLWQTESETVFGPKHKSLPLTRLSS